MMLRCMTLMTIIMMFLTEGMFPITLNGSVSALAQCNHGEVRLVNGSAPNEGRVEVCTCTCSTMSCSWGTICDDFWRSVDAQVVCRQLGYRPVGAQAFTEAHFGQGYSCQFISLDDVGCNGNERTLLECDHNGLFIHNCKHGEDAGVRCSGDLDSSTLLSNNIMNVSINNITLINTHGINYIYSILITWKWQNTSMIQYQLNAFQIECFSDQHRVEMSVNSTTLRVELFGLLPSTSYNCCVSAVNGSFTARAVCTEIVTIQPPTSQPSETPMMPTSGGPAGDINVDPDTNINETLNTYQTQESSFSASSSAVETIGGVLGFIIALLLILLTVLGAALVYLLWPKFFRSVIPKQNSTGVSVRRNVSYATTPLQHSSSTISAQAVRPTSADQNETDTAAANYEYSRIGPSYETIDSRRQQQQPAVGKNQASESAIATLSVSSRYEFSDAHLALAETATKSCTADGVVDSEVGLDYEVPQDLLTVKIEENEGYSRLQH